MSMYENKILHRVIRKLAGWAVWSFFSEVHIIGEENVPLDGPLIVYVPSYLTVGTRVLTAVTRVATHHNMMLDPAVLCQ